MQESAAWVHKVSIPSVSVCETCKCFSLWVVTAYLCSRTFDLQRRYTPWASSSTYRSRYVSSLLYILHIPFVPASVIYALLPASHVWMGLCSWYVLHVLTSMVYVDMSWDVSFWSFANVNTGLYRGILTYTNFIYTSSFGKSQIISSASKPSPNMFFSFVLGK